MAQGKFPDHLQLLDFSLPVPESEEATATPVLPPSTAARPPAPAFGEEPELPPTWSEHSRIFHTTEKCTRLQAIRRNRRITGNPGLRDHCLNCLDIVTTKRRG